MTKEVLISIRGLQAVPEDMSDKVEVIMSGEYYFRNEKHYLLFEEVMEGVSEVTKCTIKFSDNSLELTRRGPVSTHMVFEKDKKNLTYYYTPYGSILLGIQTDKIRVSEAEEQLEAEVFYKLDMNYQRVADSSIHILVRPREKGNIRL